MRGGLKTSAEINKQGLGNKWEGVEKKMLNLRQCCYDNTLRS